MKTRFSVLILVLAGLLLCSPVSAATYDLTGTWHYTLSDCWASGGQGCNPGPAASGTCVIYQTGDTFSFAFTSGVTCNPPGCCTYEGSVSGAGYSGSTTEIVDDENGSVTSTLTFTAASANSASGTGTSRYTHPSGEWECNWGENITMTRSSNDIPTITYSLTVNHTGNGTVTLDPDGGVYGFGTTVTLTAVPDPGWRFDSWSGDAEGSENGVEIVMDGDKTVSAVFTRLAGSTTGVLNLLLGD